MNRDFSNEDLQKSVNNIKHSLATKSKSLSTELEVILKNLPSYFKVVKVHIEELRKILTKNQQDLMQNISGTPTQKIITLFDEMKVEDLPLLEEIAFMAKNHTTAAVK